MSTQLNQDEEQLKLLSIFHYVLGGIIALFGLFPIFHLAFGIFMIAAPEAMAGEGGDMPPAFIGWIFVSFSAVFMLASWTFAIFVLLTGRFLKQRKRRMFCIVMAGIECTFMPLGTALGVFTIIVLMRESVQKLFEADPSIGTASASREFDESM